MRAAASSAVSVTVHVALAAAVLFGTAKAGRSTPAQPPRLIVFPEPVRTTERAVGGSAAIGLLLPQVPDASIRVPITVLQSGAIAPNLPTQTFAPPLGGSGDATDLGAVWGRVLSEAGPQVLTGPTPSYPELLRQAGVQGRVLLEAIVDTTGHVQADSIRVIEATHPAFVAPARQALAATLFRPALVAGKPVRMRVRVPYEFLIQGRDGTGRDR